MTIPRVNMNQRNRDNIPGNNAEEYYRRNIFIPLLDNIIQDLEFRFSQKVFDILEINNLIPTVLLKKTDDEIKVIKENVSQYLQNFENQSKEYILIKLNSELELWLQKWKNTEINALPDSALSSLKFCDKEMYPYVHLALRIFCTMPVSVASAERSFSSLKRLKTWLRSTMAQDRLVGLGLLHIHREVTLNIDNVVNRFASKKKRKLDFIL